MRISKFELQRATDTAQGKGHGNIENTTRNSELIALVQFQVAFGSPMPAVQ